MENIFITQPQVLKVLDDFLITILPSNICKRIKIVRVNTSDDTQGNVSNGEPSDDKVLEFKAFAGEKIDDLKVTNFIYHGTGGL